MRASWTVQGFRKRILGVAPIVSSLADKSDFSFLWDIVVEVCVDGCIDSRPGHASGPQVFQPKADTVFEIVSRVQHEGVPDHKHI